MADLATTYTLAGSSTIVFNDPAGLGSSTDLYWISAIQGLDAPTLRMSVDDVPFGDGGLVHKTWKGPKHVTLEGSLIVQSVASGGVACNAALTDLEDDLRVCLDSMVQSAGTLTWDGWTLDVYYEVGVVFQATDEYRTRSFSFGLISPHADPY